MDETGRRNPVSVRRCKLWTVTDRGRYSFLSRLLWETVDVVYYHEPRRYEKSQAIQNDTWIWFRHVVILDLAHILSNISSVHNVAFAPCLRCNMIHCNDQVARSEKLSVIQQSPTTVHRCTKLSCVTKKNLNATQSEKYGCLSCHTQSDSLATHISYHQRSIMARMFSPMCILIKMYAITPSSCRVRSVAPPTRMYAMCPAMCTVLHEVNTISFNNLTAER